MWKFARYRWRSRGLTKGGASLGALLATVGFFFDPGRPHMRDFSSAIAGFIGSLIGGIALSTAILFFIITTRNYIASRQNKKILQYYSKNDYYSILEGIFSAFITICIGFILFITAMYVFVTSIDYFNEIGSIGVSLIVIYDIIMSSIMAGLLGAGIMASLLLFRNIIVYLHSNSFDYGNIYQPPRADDTRNRGGGNGRE
jgi:hypothetical protein